LECRRPEAKINILDGRKGNHYANAAEMKTQRVEERFSSSCYLRTKKSIGTLSLGAERRESDSPFPVTQGHGKFPYNPQKKNQIRPNRDRRGQLGEGDDKEREKVVSPERIREAQRTSGQGAVDIAEKAVYSNRISSQKKMSGRRKRLSGKM